MFRTRGRRLKRQNRRSDQNQSIRPPSLRTQDSWHNGELSFRNATILAAQAKTCGKLVDATFNTLSMSIPSAPSPYSHLLSKKRSWTPVKPGPAPIEDAARATLGRALALRCLELPVGDFIEAGMERGTPMAAADLLRSNIVDEDRHDRALQLCEDAYRLAAPYEAEARQIQQAWLDAPEHPVLKALVAERSLFFVILPLFRFLGPAGLRTTAQDISRDEITHVACNTLVCDALGLESSERLNRLRRATMSWMLKEHTQALPESMARYTREFWLRQSDKLYYEGRAPELVNTRRSRQVAFFEHATTDLPAYA